MTIVQSLLLGLLQGVAEFLPISSSGHLKIAQSLFNLSDVPLLFDVMLHLATLAAVCIFFRKKIGILFLSFFSLFRKKENLSEQEAALCKNDRSYILAVIVATFVTGLIGVITKKLLDDDMISIRITCAGLIVTALLLVVSAFIEKRNTPVQKESLIPEEIKSPSLRQALIIGFAQGIGTLPGISRSGSTISGALLCGVSRQCAGEFSFIASIPAIIGAFILEVKDIGEVTGSVGICAVLAGCVAAFISGYLALAFLMKLIKKGRLEWFAVYLIPAGIIGMIFLK